VITQGKDDKWSKWRRKVRRGRHAIDKLTSMELINLVREGFSKRLRPEA